ncbi:MAG: sodium-dependent transporter [Rhodothermaceae bacterium]
MSDNLASSNKQRFSSRLGLLLSVLGIAVGTGNIWRFPRIAAQTGGEEGSGAFLIAWFSFLFLWSIPLIIAEYALGRKFRTGVVSAFSKAIGEKFTWMGSFVAFVSTAITFFYSVIVGWCIYYLIYMIFNPLPATTEEAMTIWNNYQSSNWVFLFHALAMGFGAFAIWKGVSSIERVNKILIPTLLTIVIISVIRALTLPGAWDGVSYLFNPQWNQLLDPQIWLNALTQNAWDTGAGWGLFMTYAIYMKKTHGATKNAFLTAIGNNTVSLLAALMVFGTVFSVLRLEMGMDDSQVLEVMKTSGPASTGLTFIWMPQLFARMFLGSPLAILFFLGLMFAGFSSLIAMLELPTRVMVDSGINRKKAIILVVGLCYLLGIPSAMNLDFLANQDFVWGVALMISGGFVAIAVMKYGIDKIKNESILDADNPWDPGKWWKFELRFFIPVAALILLIWWLTLSATVYSPEQWFNPFDPFSVMTCLTQWGLIIFLFLIFNKWIVKNAVSK